MTFHLLRCQRASCHYTWPYTGDNYRTSCPRCGTTVYTDASRIPIAFDPDPFKLGREVRRNTAYPVVSQSLFASGLVFAVFGNDGGTVKNLPISPKVSRLFLGITEQMIEKAIRDSGKPTNELGIYPLNEPLMKAIRKYTGMPSPSPDAPAG